MSSSMHYRHYLDDKEDGRARKRGEPALLIIKIGETEATREGVNEIRFLVESLLRRRDQMELVKSDNKPDFTQKRHRMRRWKKIEIPLNLVRETKRRLEPVLDRHRYQMEDDNGTIRIDRDDPWLDYQ